MQTLLEELFSPILLMRFAGARQRKVLHLEFRGSGQSWILISLLTARWLLASPASVLAVNRDLVLQQQREFKQLESIGITQFYIDHLTLEARLSFENEFI